MAVSGTEDSPTLYRVTYSGRVRDELMKLAQKAKDAGLGSVVLSAVKQLDYRLRLYPQFGEPVRDLSMPGQSRWIGTVPTLFVEYIIDEVNRNVYVVIPLKPMPHSGF